MSLATTSEASQTSQGRQLVVPPGQTMESLARRALALRAEHGSLRKVGAQLGIFPHSLGYMIDIVLIYDRRDRLPPDEQALAERALADLNARAASIRNIHAKIAPIGKRLWGHGMPGGQARETREALQTEKFERPLRVIVSVCAQASRVEVPPLTVQRRKEAAAELSRCIKELEALRKRVKP